jgi:LGFP repeat
MALSRRLWRALFVALLLAASLAVAVAGTTSPAKAAITVSVVNTGGDGVASRPGPHQSPTNGYGAPANAQVVANCWTWGDPVGPYSNSLWWLITYAGRQFYVNDHWLSTPTVANQPPAGQPQCGVTVASAPAPTTTMNGHNIGYPQNDWHGWGNCTVRDYKGGEFDWTIASTTVGTHIVHNGMLWGWFDNGGAPGALGCPTSDEYAFANGVRQNFQGGTLYWHGGMDHAARISSATASALNWAAGYLGTDAYDSWCLQFVHDAYKQAGKDIGGGYSAATYASAHRSQLSTSTTPPPGALVFWWGTPGYPDGHVALSVGGGWTISTSERSSYSVHVMSIADRNATKPYAGWLMP